MASGSLARRVFLRVHGVLGSLQETPRWPQTYLARCGPICIGPGGSIVRHWDDLWLADIPQAARFLHGCAARGYSCGLAPSQKVPSQNSRGKLKTSLGLDLRSDSYRVAPTACAVISFAPGRSRRISPPPITSLMAINCVPAIAPPNTDPRVPA